MNNLYAVFLNDKCVGIIPRVYYMDNHLNTSNRIKAINEMFSNMGFNGYSDYLQYLPGKDSDEEPHEVQTNASVEEYDVTFRGGYGKSGNSINISFKDIGIDLKYTSWMCNPKRNDGDECMFLLQPSTSDVRKVGYGDGVYSGRLWFCSDWSKMRITKTKPVSIDKSGYYSHYKVPFDYEPEITLDEIGNIFISALAAALMIGPIWLIFFIGVN